MKHKLLSFILLLSALIAGSTSSWAADVTYDFSKISNFSNWTTSYTEHVLNYTEATVTFASATRQTSTITNLPVTKGGDVELVMKDGSNVISKVTFVCAQWSSKAQTITLHYSTDGGSSYTSTNVTSSNFTITKDGLPAGTNAVKITFSSTKNQVGISSVSFTYGSSSTPSISLDKSSISLEKGKTAAITPTLTNVGSLDVSDVVWISSNTDVATVENGVVTAIAVGEATITAKITVSSTEYQTVCNVTVREAEKYATLPFNWEGGVSSDLTNLEGFTAYGVSDYAEAHAPYRVKFDDTGDYIQIKTDSQIGEVSIDVKMIGGAKGSSIAVKESTDGTEFTDVQTLSISGNQYDILSLKTTNAFASTSRYIRLVFTKGSNVGVGPISIEKGITIGSAGFATLFTPAALDFSGVDGLTAYTAAKDGDVVRLTPVSNVQANTGVVLEGAEGTYSIPAIATSSTAKGELKGNATEATAWNAESGYTYYVLAYTGSGVEFHPVNEGEIAAGKAFLKVKVDNGNTVHAFNVVFGDETGISEVVRDGEKESAIFDLSGRRVAKPAKGLYIVNGKKILVK